VIRALIFDLDGLLLDTESTDFAAWEHVYRQRGVALPRDRWQQAIGSDGSRFDPLEYLRARLGGSLDEVELQRARRRHRDALITRLGPCEGVAERLAEARALGLRLAVASSSEREWVEAHLARIGLRRAFDALRCREDVPRVKPDPALYLQALSALGVEAQEAVAFEDSPNGVAAALAAGLRCVAVPGPMTRGIEFGGVHLQLESLGDLALDAILERLGVDAGPRPRRRR
jgi:HAD superfamily hydrolase (TIGR01509 family)